MKLATIAAILGVGQAVDIKQPSEALESLIQEAENMEEVCKDMDTIDESSLLEAEEDIELEKNIKGTEKKHYNRSKKQIDAENNHILSTQAKCLKFVRKYRGHPKVCNWCKKAKAPSVIWKWDPSTKTWYRWYDNKWHYWGPSKRGFTSIGWTWYKGFWHHNGWVFKYTGGYWYRFQGHKWVRYGKTVNIKPTVPRGAKICRPFYMLKKFGFPSSLGAKSLPRCKVGSGKKAIYYMWKNRAGCRFLGGRLVYQKHAVCKAGKPHQWARVVRCVRGAVLSKKGLNYKTGQRHSLVQICAKEGGKCKCTGTMIYGHGKTWAQVLKKKNVIKKVKGVTSCTNKALGKDPLPGVGKVCMCKK